MRHRSSRLQVSIIRPFRERRMSIHHLLRICRSNSDFPSPTVRTIHQIINQGNDQVPCTFRPASTWILAPVMLVFLANMMNASAPVQRQKIALIQNLSSRKGLQSCKSVSCFKTALSIANWILSSEYFLPCTTESAQVLIPRSFSRGKPRHSRKTYPFGQKQSRKHRVHADLRTLRRT